MPRDGGLRWGRVLGGVLVLAVIAVVVSVLARGRALPDRPQPVAWNQQACAHCRMAVGEPAHAAQLVTTGGDVLFFDDPGCLLRYLDERAPHVHRIWFHHGADDRWLTDDEVGFLPGASTPMGFGLATTDRSTAGALDLAAARRWIGLRHAGEVSDARAAADTTLPSHADAAHAGAPAGELR
jgi:hypothetical protein